MPTTVATVLVLIVAVVPGAFGSFLFQSVNGLDWREKDWGAAIRFVAFSAIGLSLYAIIAAWLGWPAAAHVVPATYTSNTFQANSVSVLAVPFLGHLACGGLVGLGAAFGARALADLTAGTHRAGAWDAFARDSAPGRWIVATLKSGDVYAGFIAVADTGVPSGDRDIVLREPARYDADSKEYCATAYRDIYLPAGLVQNLATVALADDSRVGPPAGESLWKGIASEREAT